MNGVIGLQSKKDIKNMKKKILGISVGVNDKASMGNKGYIGWSIIEIEDNFIDDTINVAFSKKNKDKFEIINNFMIDNESNTRFKIFKTSSKKECEDILYKIGKKYKKLFAGVGKNYEYIIISNDSMNLPVKDRQIIAIKAMDFYLNYSNLANLVRFFYAYKRNC